MQAYNQAINDLDKELDYLKHQFEVPKSVSFSPQSLSDISVWNPFGIEMIGYL